MHRNEIASEARHLRAADGRLQPLAVVKRRVPVVDRGVIAADGKLQLIVVIVSQDRALDLRAERMRIAGGRRTRKSGDTDLREVTPARGQRGDAVQHELSLGESAVGWW